MLFQRLGGLQVQVVETMNALSAAGHDVCYFNSFEDRLEDFDIIHVFSVINGNHRIVEAAVAANKPVIASTVLHPPFTSKDRWWCELAGKAISRLVGWSVTTSFHQIGAALDGASHVVALGPDERSMIIDGYGLAADKISVIPNGVADRFFDSTPALFEEKFEPQRSRVVCIASVDERKNQATAAAALRDLDTDFYMFGPCEQQAGGYLDRVVAAGGGNVQYCGSLAYDAPLLPSAYAAADVMVLPSLSEVMPISVLEALAAGTPVVMTKNHSLGLAPAPGILEMVDPRDVNALRAACEKVLAAPPEREQVRALVRDYSWSTVAQDLCAIYESLLQRQG
jgi:glycosyltransferase involved in cell wall biosynthesis